MKIVLQVAALSIPVCAVAQTAAQAPQEIGKYEIHQVKKGETLYSLSRRYNTSVPAILDLNPDIINNNLKAGSSVKIPKAGIATAPGGNDAYKGIGPKPYLVPVYYEVAKGQTLYAIGQQTGNDVEVVKLWNDLKTNNIRPGQKLIVGYAEQSQTIAGKPRVTEKPADAPSVAVVQTTDKKAKPEKKLVDTKNDKVAVASKHTPSQNETVASTSKGVLSDKPVIEKSAATTSAGSTTATKESTELKTGSKPVSVYDSNPSTAKLVYLNEKGICTWSRGSNENGSFYALHPTAPIGSTISVKNMMNNRSVQVKVIGRLPNTPENENIAIKISGSAAKELNAVDTKFLTQMSYMGYEKAKLM